MAALVLGGVAVAGDWHQTDTLVCSDCHTIHNSSGGAPMRYDGLATPAPKLLRAADPVALCLTCHDGSDLNAPDVVAPVTYLTNPAGGWFAENPLGAVNANGHDLSPLSPTPAPGSNDALTLTCASCHDIHGNTNYRNLTDEPPGSGNGGPVSVTVNQQVLPNGTNPGAVYAPGNLRYKAGMSAWCNDCHTDFHGRTAGEEGTVEPWLRHPQAQALSGSYGADYTHWSGSITNRVPVQTPTDDTIPSADDEVFCLSCHKAHGSMQEASLIYADGTTRLSTCQQCHNQ
jgi:predicted CXXCH cytochrome family protein